MVKLTQLSGNQVKDFMLRWTSHEIVQDKCTPCSVQNHKTTLEKLCFRIQRKNEACKISRVRIRSGNTICSFSSYFEWFDSRNLVECLFFTEFLIYLNWVVFYNAQCNKSWIQLLRAVYWFYVKLIKIGRGNQVQRHCLTTVININNLLCYFIRKNEKPL